VGWDFLWIFAPGGAWSALSRAFRRISEVDRDSEFRARVFAATETALALDRLAAQREPDHWR
jgi:hypothetical protein